MRVPHIGRLECVIHRIDDLENIQRGSSNPIEFYHRSDDSKFLFQNLKRHVLSLKGRIKLIKTFSFKTKYYIFITFEL